MNVSRGLHALRPRDRLIAHDGEEEVERRQTAGGDGRGLGRSPSLFPRSCNRAWPWLVTLRGYLLNVVRIVVGLAGPEHLFDESGADRAASVGVLMLNRAGGVALVALLNLVEKNPGRGNGAESLFGTPRLCEPSFFRPPCS